MNPDEMRRALDQIKYGEQRRLMDRRKRDAARAAERSRPAPLVVGSVYGIRAFRLHAVEAPGRSPEGRLWPLSSVGTGSWKPGWNSAMCPNRCAERGRDVDPFVNGMLLMHPMNPMIFGRPPAPATVALDCSCGFHAFTKLDEMESQVPSTDADVVTGIVEGAGTTVIATHGFRAGRARVVALISRRPKLRIGPIWAAFIIMLFAAASCLNSVLDGWDPLSWLNVGLGLFNLAFGGFNGYRLWRHYRARRSLRQLAQAFGVPLYASQAEAVAAFPLGLTGPGGAS